MFNIWYFFWILLGAGLIVGLYFALRKANEKVQKGVLFGLLALGLLFHFLKVYIPPYSVDEARMLRDSWFINICGANIALFPFFFWSKNKYIKDYMCYIGILSGFIALVYPTEPIDKVNQLAEFWDIVRFYFHHWMLMAVPLLMLIFKHHELSYKRILTAPIGLLLVLLFIIINQIFQSELGFIPLRGEDMLNVNYKNTSWIWGPRGDAVSDILLALCPDFFKTIPVGAYAGQTKCWPWFWLIFPIFILATPLAFGLSMIFDHRNFGKDMKALYQKLREFIEYAKQGKWAEGVHCLMPGKQTSAQTETAAEEVAPTEAPKE